jgi:type II secretory pathway pseudopilin PulG
MRKLSGYTLVELVISMFVTGIVVAAVLSVALSSKKGSGKHDRKLIASELSRGLTTMLRTYVTADPTTTIIPGPGSGLNRWSMDSPPINDLSCVDCYALSPGSHPLSGFLPGWFEASPYNAQITYFVAYPQAYSVANGTVPLVNVTLNWTDS